MPNIIPVENIYRKIYLIQGKKVMLDSDLAELYGVEVKRLNEQVKRNVERFPILFMFQLKAEEYAEVLRSQNASLKQGQHRKYLPYVFTEHGILMLSSILNSKKAIDTSVLIIEVFIRMRDMLTTHLELKQKVEEHDQKINMIIDIVGQLLEEPPENNEKRKIGFI